MCVTWKAAASFTNGPFEALLTVFAYVITNEMAFVQATIGL